MITTFKPTENRFIFVLNGCGGGDRHTFQEIMSQYQLCCIYYGTAHLSDGFKT
uniref:Uncharacterized protein n=1 Tax=Arion vulgaris TaxID=1028688 RepID=A0A0B7AXK7_9EUPU